MQQAKAFQIPDDTDGTSCYIITPTIDARLVGGQLIHENVFTSLPLCPESHRLARYYTPMPVSRRPNV